MRRVTLMLLGAILALALLSPAAYSDETTTDSEQDSEGTGEQTTLKEETAPEATEDLGPRPKPMSEVSGPVSQGSAVLGPGLPEENFPDYSQVVDNDSKNFKAPGWKKQSSLSGYHGESYAVAGSAKAKAAQYKVEIPATGKYSVYAWLPAGSDNTSAARFGITTASGTKWVKINQQRDGGFWGKIGEYEMKRGESYAVKIAPGSEGRTVADAIAVVRGVLSGPPDDESVSSAEGSTFRASGSSPSRQAVVRKARDYLGKRYRWGTCTRARMSCTCLTRKAFQPFGHKLAMSEGKQWRYAKKRGKVIKSRSNLRPGDLLFFKENGKNGPITHVGVAAKSGWIVHSSAYFGRVVEKQHKYINGFHAGVRLKLR